MKLQDTKLEYENQQLLYTSLKHLGTKMRRVMNDIYHENYQHQ